MLCCYVTDVRQAPGHQQTGHLGRIEELVVTPTHVTPTHQHIIYWQRMYYVMAWLHQQDGGSCSLLIRVARLSEWSRAHQTVQVEPEKRIIGEIRKVH